MNPNEQTEFDEIKSERDRLKVDLGGHKEKIQQLERQVADLKLRLLRLGDENLNLLFPEKADE